MPNGPLFLAIHGPEVRHLIVLVVQEMNHPDVGLTTYIQEDCSVVVAIPDGDSTVCPVGVTRTLAGAVRLRLRACDTRQHAEAALAEFDATQHDVAFDHDDLRAGENIACDGAVVLAD